MVQDGGSPLCLCGLWGLTGKPLLVRTVCEEAFWVTSLITPQQGEQRCYPWEEGYGTVQEWQSLEPGLGQLTCS